MDQQQQKANGEGNVVSFILHYTRLIWNVMQIKLGIAATFMKSLTKASAQSAIKVLLKKTVSTKAFYPWTPQPNSA